MKKSFTILMALVITFFTVPFGGITAMADEKAYDNIADGEHMITVKALHANEDKASGAAMFIEEDAILSVQDGEIELILTIPHVDIAEVTFLQLEGVDPNVTDDGKAKHNTYKVSELKSILNGIVKYTIGNSELENVHDLRFNLQGLDNLPVNEESDNEEDLEEPGDNDNSDDGSDNDNGSGTEDGSDGSEDEDAEEDREKGELVKNADRTYEVEYVSSLSIDRYFDNPVTLLYKGGKKYIQINGNSAQFITSLTINGTEVTWGEINEDGTYVIQFEIEGSLSDELNFGMKIDTGRLGADLMEHNTLLSFETKDIDVHKLEVKNGKVAPVYSGDNITVSGDETTKLALPENLPSGVTVTITSAKEKVENQDDLEIAGEVYNFNFEGIEDYDGTFELVMGYDTSKYNADQVDIYYYDEEKDKWIAQKGTVEDGTITIKPTHFSMYGVFAKESEEDLEGDGEEPSEEYREVDYIVKHVTEDKPSSADSFFTKPAHLIERDGDNYIQLTIKSWSMIDWLRTEHGDVTIIEENDNYAIVEFKVNGDLSDAIYLKMQVTVPGLYEMEHEARLFLDVDEDGKGGAPLPTPPPKPTSNPTPTPVPKPEEKTEVAPEKAYEIDYIVKHATEDRISAADSFFVKPAYLLYDKDGVKYIQLVIKDWNMIDWLRTEHGDVLVVKENDDGSALIQFKVTGNLSNEILLNMSVTVPGLYSMEHEARLIFDTDSQEEIDPNNFQIIADPANPKGPGKPKFGNGDDNGNNGKDTVKPSENGNPQTGDTTNILLYSMLLIGSLIPLAVKLRRRFV